MTPDDSHAILVAKVNQERAIQRAEDDIPVIEALLDSKGWTYLTRKLREHAAALRTNLENDSLTDQETRTTRALIKQIDAVLLIPATDRAQLNLILANAKQRREGPARG